MTQSPLSSSSREYSQLLFGDVTIKKRCNNNYKITFRKNISDALLYQNWIKNSPLNSNRRVFFISAKKWVKNFFPHPLPPNHFAPTTVMEFPTREKCVFIINDAKVKKGHVIFYVSTKNIVLPSKITKRLKMLKKIPLGDFHDIRFDIDDVDGTDIWDAFLEGLGALGGH